MSGHFALFNRRKKSHSAAMPAPARADYSFASDNTAGIAPEAWAALAAANAGCAPSYGDDDWTARAKELIHGIFETDCEVFFVFNGTAANALALAHLGRSHHSIFCHDYSHVDTDECGAPEFFSGGSKVIAVAGPGGKLRPADLEPARRRGHGVHYPKPGALSLTQSTEWGTVYTPDEVRALADWAHGHGLAVQMDGARFANAAAALGARGHRPADFTWRAGVDVLSFGGTKNGMHTTEAVVFFNRGQAREFDYRMKQGAQLASKQRFSSAQWCGMLESGAWLHHAAHANAMARRLADALRPLPGVRLIVEPEVNGVFAELPAAAFKAMGERGWHFHRFVGVNGYRLMCSWATQPAEIDRFVADLRSAVAAEG
jgi:threonine aldolase